MLCDLKELKEKYNLEIKHAIHIGAHHGTELDVYEKLSIERVLMFEPVPTTFDVLKEKVDSWSSSKSYPKEIMLANLALGNSESEVEMHIENNNKGMSSSLLKPKLHLEQYEWIKFNQSDNITVKQVKLDSYMEKVPSREKFNFINIDVQGYELEVFKGAESTLRDVSAIYTEVNRAELYEGCCMVSELDEFLGSRGFTRVETNWEGISWGDALYIRK